MDNICYIRRKKIGEGTYATIYKADKATSASPIPHKITNDTKGLRILGPVAIKKMKRWDDGIEISTIREIKTLMRINDPYLCNIEEVFCFNQSMHIVLEYAEGNLDSLIRNKNHIFMPADIKWMFFMICRGVYALHSRFILHRDLKPANILISNGILKLADFGLSRSIGEQMTSNVVTRWYRAPELFYGEKEYTFSVDIWGLGCILGELLLRVPMFPGEDDFKQLDLIFKTLGTPTQDTWPGMVHLPNYLEYPSYPAIPLKRLFTSATEDLLDLISSIFKYDPTSRKDISDILKHEYFSTDPLPDKTSPVLSFNPSKGIVQ